MPRLFGQNIAKIINDSIAAAGGVLDATLIVVTEGQRQAGNLTGGVRATETRRACKGFIDSYAENRIDGTIIKQGDRRVTLLGNSIQGGAVPSKDDKIEIEGEVLQIVSIPNRDPAAATYTCQCRA